MLHRHACKGKPKTELAVISGFRCISQLIVHFYNCGRACLHRSFFIGWQDIHSGSGIVYFGNLVLADTQSFNEDFTLFVCFKGDIIAVCSGNAEAKPSTFPSDDVFTIFRFPRIGSFAKPCPLYFRPDRSFRRCQ